MLRLLQKRPLLVHMLVGGTGYAIQDAAVIQPLTSAYEGTDWFAVGTSFLAGACTAGVWCRYWYPFVHRFSPLPAAAANASAQAVAAAASSQVLRKTLLDLFPFLGLALGGLAVLETSSFLRLAEVEEAEKALHGYEYDRVPVLVCSQTLITGQHIIARMAGDLLFSASELDFPYQCQLRGEAPGRVIEHLMASREMAETARGIIELSPDVTWLMQPCLSFALFKFVPLPFQGLAGLGQILVLNSVNEVVHREELQRISDIIANVDAAVEQVLGALEDGVDVDIEFGGPEGEAGHDEDDEFLRPVPVRAIPSDSKNTPV